ncbi:uncharacterized protein LOC111051299 [Nilaparvata lugens]|uniref:uncharacterized protein LOC111051299 n=1 Tax=Nilaparvata lugens TaxID=108931 RepID=UPI00193DFAE7|nr:uncharacterized protein LOC111051299 [Nilaparvata lugens]
MRKQNRAIHHPILHIRSVDPAANKSLANDSNIDFENNFGFDDEPDLPIVDVSKNKSSSSNANHSVHKVHPTTNRTVQKSKKSEAKFGISNNFGFDDDSTNSVIVDKNKTKTSNTSTASTANTSIKSTSNTSLASTSSVSIKSTSNGSILNASTTSLENDKAKKPEVQFNDVIKRLKGQLNITAVSTPVSTKQTKLNFSSFKNKSTVSNESAADTTICSPIAQPTSSGNLGLTPTFLKPPRKSYTHTPTAKKVVRFGTSFAVDQNEMKDDDELAKDLFEETVKEKPAPKKANQTYKKTSKAGKKEEKEIERLVSAINSQFQKVEEFQLCVEK